MGTTASRTEGRLNRETVAREGKALIRRASAETKQHPAQRNNMWENTYQAREFNGVVKDKIDDERMKAPNAIVTFNHNRNENSRLPKPKPTYEYTSLDGEPVKVAPKQRKWTPEQDEALRRSVKKYHGKNWKVIALEVPGRNHVQCLQRWKKVLTPGLVKGHWTPEEDEVLKKVVRRKDISTWAKVAEYVPGRTAKQCRERWSLNLDPTINRGPWTEEENLMLLAIHQHLGNKWADIALLMPGRTENAVKTRFKSLVRKDERRWTLDEDLGIIRNKYIHGANWSLIAKFLPGRSKNAVRVRWKHLIDLDSRIDRKARELKDMMPIPDDQLIPKGSPIFRLYEKKVIPEVNIEELREKAAATKNMFPQQQIPLNLQQVDVTHAPFPGDNDAKLDKLEVELDPEKVMYQSNLQTLQNHQDNLNMPLDGNMFLQNNYFYNSGNGGDATLFSFAQSPKNNVITGVSNTSPASSASANAFANPNINEISIPAVKSELRRARSNFSESHIGDLHVVDSYDRFLQQHDTANTVYQKQKSGLAKHYSSMKNNNAMNTSFNGGRGALLTTSSDDLLFRSLLNTGSSGDNFDFEIA